MGKVAWADAIKTVSGALTKINKKSAHAADQKMVLATHRTAPSANGNCSRIYLRGLSSVTRSTPYSADERTLQQNFATAAAATRARIKNVSTIQADKAAFAAQTEYKTLYQYIFNDEYDKLRN